MKNISANFIVRSPSFGFFMLWRIFETIISLPVWLYEFYLIMKSLLKKHDPLVLLFPVFDVFRSVFFIKGIFEYLFGTKRVGR